MRAEHRQDEPARLQLDEHTLDDLEIFAAKSGGRSLFEFCDRTETKGGSRALRRRMQRPWVRPQDIRSTQESLAFVMAHRRAFEGLPSAFLVGGVERYLRRSLPVSTAEHAAEFALFAIPQWLTDRHGYVSILNGVQFTSRLIQVLRRFAAQPELAEVPGELAQRCDALRTLLEAEALDAIPGAEGRSSPWVVLRLHQRFRLRAADLIRRALELVYEIDALVALADVTADQALVMPEVRDGPLALRAERLVHPLLEGGVTNPLALDQAQRLLFLTGPNMAGKTTYLRSVAIALYLAQLGMGVPAQRFEFTPAEHLFSSISLADDFQAGVSYFRAEALRVRAIAGVVAAGHRVVALMDEPFKGTNVKDALDASRSILERFAEREDCLFLCSSHLIELSASLAERPEVDCRHFAADEQGGRLRFDFRLREGISDQRLGMRVLAEEGVFELLDGTAEQERGTGRDEASS